MSVSNPSLNRRRLLQVAGLAATTGLPHVSPASAQSDTTSPEAILPKHRIISYYGFPENKEMGILGEHSKPDLLKLLQDQAAVYAELDPSRPTMLAFETMASVAMKDSGPDNDHLEYTDADTLDDYAKFTARNGMLLFLDVQFGRNTIEREIYKVERWMREPHVHLALDPEFAVGEAEVPGETLGTIDSNDLQFAVNALSALVTDYNLPPKIMLVHQFNWASITRPELLRVPNTVQIVHEIDGWGAPDEKRETYGVLTGLIPDAYQGFKLWYRQDEPLMTEAEVLSLAPVPDVVIYQ